MGSKKVLYLLHLLLLIAGLVGLVQLTVAEATEETKEGDYWSLSRLNAPVSVPRRSYEYDYDSDSEESEVESENQYVRSPGPSANFSYALQYEFGYQNSVSVPPCSNVEVKLTMAIPANDSSVTFLVSLPDTTLYVWNTLGTNSSLPVTPNITYPSTTSFEFAFYWPANISSAVDVTYFFILGVECNLYQSQEAQVLTIGCNGTSDGSTTVDVELNIPVSQTCMLPQEFTNRLELYSYMTIRRTLFAGLNVAPLLIKDLSSVNKVSTCLSLSQNISTWEGFNLRKYFASNPNTIRNLYSLYNDPCPVVTGYLELVYTGTAEQAVSFWRTSSISELTEASYYGIGVSSLPSSSPFYLNTTSFLLSLVTVRNFWDECPPIQLPSFYPGY